jgi:hypothetical protein
MPRHHHPPAGAHDQEQRIVGGETPMADLVFFDGIFGSSGCDDGQAGQAVTSVPGTIPPESLPMIHRSRRALAPAAALVLSLLAAGCGEKAPPPKAVPPEVGVITVQPRTVPVIYEQVGQSAGFREIEVRPRVSGILQNSAS